MVTLGWREWLALPELGIPAIKAKIDTGARTSALHAWGIEAYRAGRRRRVRFGVNPLQKNSRFSLLCDAEVVDERYVTDSGGHREKRLVIVTLAHLGPLAWPIEITLSDREPMIFRMLLGRSALHHQCIVDPSRSYIQGRALQRVYRNLKSGE
ncbi:MAG: ATP-dependent zinc protease [Candidatus Hydrogenedentes bacterium]|nr:ATP-dependent zinc protease [Candidatus Hydrogenedentota bacterium]